MPDTLDVNGLQVEGLPALVSDLTTAIQAIYGPGVNVGPSTPDGQLIAILAQVGEDLRELLVLINAGFDPDQAEGATLDQRVALNNIKRNSGTFTTVQVTLTLTKAAALVGLDSQAGVINPAVPNLYTVKDSGGGLWYLLASQTIAAAGTYTYIFQAATLGAVQVTAGSITTPVTIVPGVSGINNASGALVQGVAEETDAALKIRRRSSTAISATGYLDTLQAALANLLGVTGAWVDENNSGSTDSYGTPTGTIWCIVQGGVPAQIAQTIYSKRNLGAAMRGAQSFTIPRPNGGSFVAKWDVPTTATLYVRFTLRIPGGKITASFIANQVVNNLFWGVGQDAVGDVFTAYLRTLNSAYRVTALAFSLDNTTWSEVVPSPSPAVQFVMSTANMVISS